MTDKELLELSAKAAGMNAVWVNPDDADYLAEREGLWLNGERSPDNSKYWNPLTDDGDALRLAVKLGMEISIDLPSEVAPATVWAMADADNGSGASNYLEKDAYAATRRAIVRAAAEIGKGMP